MVRCCSVAAASLLEGCILGRHRPASNPELPLKQGGTLQSMINFYLETALTLRAEQS
jgi:hypothetical protein